MTVRNLNLRIVIPISVLCYGGSEVQTLHLIRALNRSNCRVEVICFYEYYDDVVRIFEESGATVELLNYLKRNNKIKLLTDLFRYYRKKKPDVVHVQYIEQGFIALMAAWVARVPIRIATVHQLGTPYKTYQRALLRIASYFTNAFLSVSQAVERSWFGNSAVWSSGRGEIRRHWTIYNCVDVDLIKKLASHIDRNALLNQYDVSECPLVGIVGRATSEKGHSVLLDAISLVVKKLPDVKILMVGEDLQRDALMAKAELMGLRRKVIMTKRLPPEEVYKLYGIMDVVVVPSRFEGFGLTAAEAMAAGRPVVASRIGGLVEIVKDGVTGFLVEPQNYQELAKAIMKCLLNQDLAKELGDAGFQRVSKMFSTDVFDNAINTLYKSTTDSDKHYCCKAGGFEEYGFSRKE